MAHFTVKKITPLADLKLDDVLPESDYSAITPDNKFIQLEYVSDEKKNARN
jgi:hypothetical protein